MANKRFVPMHGGPQVPYQIDPRGEHLRQVMSPQEWRDLERQVNMNQPAGLVATNEKLFVSPREAAATLGLSAHHTSTAERMIESVVKDTRDMLGIVNEGRRAGIPEAAMATILRRGQQMRWRASLIKSKGDTDGGKPDPQSHSAAQTKADAVDRDVQRRYEGCKAKAKRHGLTISGKLKPHHTHDHIDRLEDRLNEHVKGKTTKESAEKRAARRAPVSPPAKQAATNEIGGITERLMGLGHRVDDDHRPLFDRLVAEGKAVGENPSGPAIDWYERRVGSFVHLMTGQGPDGEDDGTPPRFTPDPPQHGGKAEDDEGDDDDDDDDAGKPKAKAKKAEAAGVNVNVKIGKSRAAADEVFLDLRSGDLLLAVDVGPEPALPHNTPPRRSKGPPPPPPTLVVEPPQHGSSPDPLEVWGELEPLAKSREVFAQLISGEFVLSGDLREVPAHLLPHPAATVARLDAVGAGDLVKAWA